MGGPESPRDKQQGRTAHRAWRGPQVPAALLRTHEIGIRASAVGFDWERASDVVAKIEEEVEELREWLGEGASGNGARAEEEMGDLLFAIANLSRKLGIEPESALRKANDKFSRRFSAMESRLRAAGRSLSECALQEMEDEWSRVKQAERAASSVRTQGQAPPAERPDDRHAAVRAKRDGAVEVGPEDMRPDCAVAVQHRRVWVPVPVASPGAENSQVRGRRLEERPGARRRAPMVRREHHPNAGRPDELGDCGFRGSFHVAGQEQGDIAEPHLHDDRVVIPHALALPRGRFGVPHGHVRLAEADAVALLYEPPGCADAARGRPELPQQRLRRHRNALPHLIWTEVGDHRRRAADVIGIAVRGQDVRQPKHARLPDGRLHHSASDVEPPSASTAGVDEHGVA